MHCGIAGWSWWSVGALTTTAELPGALQGPKVAVLAVPGRCAGCGWLGWSTKIAKIIGIGDLALILELMNRPATIILP